MYLRLSERKHLCVARRLADGKGQRRHVCPGEQNPTRGDGQCVGTRIGLRNEKLRILRFFHTQSTLLDCRNVLFGCGLMFLGLSHVQAGASGRRYGNEAMSKSVRSDWRKETCGIYPASGTSKQLHRKETQSFAKKAAGGKGKEVWNSKTSQHKLRNEV